MAAIDMAKYPVHLGRGGAAQREPEFTGGMEWYSGYGERHGADGVDGRLVSMFSFKEPWDTWEMHPSGGEVVICTQGVIVMHQESPDGSRRTTTLRPGQYVINEPGVWHTADVDAEATAVFITSGLGTTVRPR